MFPLCWKSRYLKMNWKVDHSAMRSILFAIQVITSLSKPGVFNTYTRFSQDDCWCYFSLGDCFCGWAILQFCTWILSAALCEWLILCGWAWCTCSQSLFPENSRGLSSQYSDILPSGKDPPAGGITLIYSLGNSESRQLGKIWHHKHAFIMVIICIRQRQSGNINKS